MVPSLYTTLWKYKISFKNKNHLLTLQVLYAEVNFFVPSVWMQCLEGYVVPAAFWILIK